MHYKEVWALLLEASREFSNHKAMKMSASLAYYTIFSIAPLLLIVIWIMGFLYGEHIAGQGSMQAEVFGELAALFGIEVARQIQQVIEKISLSDESGIGIAVGIGTLIAGSTTIFIEIQDSLNTIWGLKAKPKKGWLKMLVDRALSFSMVLGLGFLLIASLLLNGIIVALSNQIGRHFPEVSLWMVEWINIGLTFLVITTLFGTIFGILPDARLRFRDIVGGALFTALLFMLGRYLISLYMQYSAPASAYGAAGAIIVLLLWIYYSAAILYFGAAFTKAYARRYGRGISPASYAVRVIQEEVEIEQKNLASRQAPPD